jgi:hypothetical protein
MTTYYVVMGGICFFVGVITVLDLLARRQLRRDRHSSKGDG